MALEGPARPNAAGFGFAGQFAEKLPETVQSGETTLAAVAKRLGQDVEALLQANPQIRDPNSLKAGQDIHLPQAEARPEQAPAETAIAAPEAGWAQALQDDPTAKAIAKLQLQQRVPLAPNAGANPAQGGPGTVLSWKRDQGAAGSSTAVKAQAPAAGSVTVGARLGVNGKGEEVRVKREVGSTQGYDDKWQAMAVARLGGAEPAAVVLVDKKWHALETTAAIDAKFSPANATQVMHGLPSSADIADAQKRVKELQTRLEELRNMKPTKDVEQQKDQVVEALTKANLRRASLILGVPESDIRFKGNPSGREAGYINIIPNKDANAPAGSHGPAPGQGGELEFKPGMTGAFDINYSTLDSPAWAQLTLYHEVEHQKHWDRAQEWVKTYEKETGRPFVRAGLKYFKDWMEDQAAKVKPPRLSKADADLVVDVAGNFDGMTEARANMRAVLTAFQAGAPDLAAKALTAYASALTPKSQGGLGRYSTPHPKSQFMIGLREELRAAYQKMPKDVQRKFDDAIAAAKKQYPNAWVSELNLR